MSDQEMVAARAAGEDVLGRRVFLSSVDRARTFGSSSLSGVLDIFGGIVLIASAVIVLLVVFTGPDLDDEWLTACAIAIGGATSGLMLFALSRLVTYAKACAVLLAKVSSENP